MKANLCEVCCKDSLQCSLLLSCCCHAEDILREFREFLAIPNVASTPLMSVAMPIGWSSHHRFGDLKRSGGRSEEGEEELQTPWIGVPIANHGNNQHAANQNLRLQNLWDGIDLMAALMRL